MLKQRVITAAVLLALLLPAIFMRHPMPFIVLTLLAVCAAGWEWARLNGAQGVAAIAAALALGVACAVTVRGGWSVGAPAPVWWAAGLLWILAVPWLLRGGPSAWPRLPQLVRLVVGLVLLWAAWLALGHAKVTGVNFLLSVFALVWVADIAAYFGGRRYGKRKLAPSISPGKSWEGVYSGMAGVFVLALVWMQADTRLSLDSASVFTLLRQGLGWIGAAVALAVLAAMSVVGDLFESLVKRAVGAKDSSRLLPGHGGVLDRIDALLPVFPIAMALITL